MTGCGGVTAAALTLSVEPYVSARSRILVMVVAMIAAIMPCRIAVAGTKVAPEPVSTDSLASSGAAKVDAAAPWLAGWTLEDQVWNLRKAFADTSTDRVALVFFATWCAPCKQGVMQLTARAADLKAAGVSVVLVDYQEDAAKVRGFLGDKPAFPVVLDRFGASEQSYLRTNGDQVRLPRTVLIGRDMKVQAIFGSEGGDYVDRLLSGR